MKIAVIATTFPQFENFCSHWSGIKQGLEELKIQYIFLTCRPDFTSFEKLKNFQPDIIIYGLRDIIYRPEWRERIRDDNPNAKIVLYYGDMRDRQEPADCSEMDAMFVSNDEQESFYKRIWNMKEVYYLPLGSAQYDKPDYNKNFDFDFVFIGGQFGGNLRERSIDIETLKRQHGLKHLNSNDPEIRLKIVKAMPEIYRSSKTVLDQAHYTNVKGYTSIRFFEIPAMRGLALTKRFPGCTDLFPEDTRVYWDTLEELLEKRNYYLSHETERQEMIEKGYEQSKNNSYAIRIKKMLKCLNLA